MTSLIAKCGIDCGHCPAFRDNATNLERRRRCSEGWATYLNFKLKPERCICESCQVPDPWKSGNLIPDRSCVIRLCAVKTGVENCAYCTAFPCGSYRPDVSRSAVEARLGRPVAEEDYRSFIEPFEHFKRLEALRRALRQDQLVTPHVKPVPAKLASFPTMLESNDIAGFRALYALLCKIRTSPATTYARQIALQRRSANLLHLLWTTARYGQVAAGRSHLTVSSSIEAAPKDLQNLVHKQDRRLHTNIAQALAVARDWGLRAECRPIEKKEWQLEVWLTEEAGGSPALRALKAVTTALVEAFGEPSYAGSSHFKGRAFAAFAQADLSIIARDHAPRT